MHKFIFFDNRIVPREKSFVPAVSSAAFYGKGVFTTVAIYRAKPFQLQKHLRRLKADAEKTGVDLSAFGERFIEDALFSLIEKNELKNARARLTFFDRKGNAVWNFGQKTATGFLIATADFRDKIDNLRLTFSPFNVNSNSPLTGVKSCNYLENLLALDEAKTRNFDEAIRANERGEIVAAAMANVFWIKEGEIFTPHLKTGCLEGTTRGFLMENFAVRETKARFGELEQADEIFLTSAGIGIAKAANLNEKILSHRITNDIEEKFLCAVQS